MVSNFSIHFYSVIILLLSLLIAGTVVLNAYPLVSKPNMNYDEFASYIKSSGNVGFELMKIFKWSILFLFVFYCLSVLLSLIRRHVENKKGYNVPLYYARFMNGNNIINKLYVNKHVFCLTNLCHFMIQSYLFMLLIILISSVDCLPHADIQYSYGMYMLFVSYFLIIFDFGMRQIQSENDSNNVFVYDAI